MFEVQVLAAPLWSVGWSSRRTSRVDQTSERGCRLCFSGAAAADQREAAHVVQKTGQCLSHASTISSPMILHVGSPPVFLPPADSRGGQRPLLRQQPIGGGAPSVTEPVGGAAGPSDHLLQLLPEPDPVSGGAASTEGGGGRGGGRLPSSESGESAGRRGGGEPQTQPGETFCHMTIGVSIFMFCRRWAETTAPSSCSRTNPPPSTTGESLSSRTDPAPSLPPVLTNSSVSRDFSVEGVAHSQDQGAELQVKGVGPVWSSQLSPDSACSEGSAGSLEQQHDAGQFLQSETLFEEKTEHKVLFQTGSFYVKTSFYVRVWRQIQN